MGQAVAAFTCIIVKPETMQFISNDTYTDATCQTLDYFVRFLVSQPNTEGRLLGGPLYLAGRGKDAAPVDSARSRASSFTPSAASMFVSASRPSQ